jgi:hypothetical protein
VGHIISASGIKPDPEKIKAIVELPRPTNILGLQSFLGLVAFVRKFIPNCSKLIAPLTALLKKGVKFEWNFEREKNFEELKNLHLQPRSIHHSSNKLIIVNPTKTNKNSN